MTPADLTAIRRSIAEDRGFSDQATEWPWFSEFSSGAYYRVSASRGTHNEVIAEFKEAMKWDGRSRVPDKDRSGQIVNNMIFVEWSRYALPAACDQREQLAASLEAAWKRIGELEAELEAWCKHWGCDCPADSFVNSPIGKIYDRQQKELNLRGNRIKELEAALAAKDRNEPDHAN